LGVARIPPKQVCSIVEEFTHAPESKGCNAQALRKMLRCTYIKGTRHVSTYISPMAFILGVPNNFIAYKNRPDEAHIIHVSPASIRVINGEHIARVYVITKLLQDCLTLKMQCADVYSNIATTLHHSISLSITKCGGKVS